MNEIIINGIIEGSQEVSGEMRYAVGTPGADGVGISDIFKTSTVGNVDTYTIFLTDGTTKTFTVTNGIENIDQTYSPTSENAQSGIAVAQAVDPRTVYQKFIDDNNLKQRNWVDLSFVGGEYYYTDFLQAVADVNANTTVNSTTDSTNAVCQIFKNDEITVLRLLSNISVTTNVIFEKSVIFDINGFTVSCSENGIFGNSVQSNYDCTVVFYGAKSGSNITGTDVSRLIKIQSKYFYILSGEYSLNCINSGSFNFDASEVATSGEIHVEIHNAFISSNSTRPYTAARVNTPLYCVSESLSNATFGFYNTKFVSKSKYTRTYGMRLTAKTIKRVCINNCSFVAETSDLGDDSGVGLIIDSTNSIIKNSNIYGITSGMQNSGILYLQNCKCYSPYHGGVYNATDGFLYAENCEFHRSVCPDGYTPTGWAASYFGYSSTAYLNDCSFILDTEGDTSDGIAIKQGDTTEPTYVYMSNCELPKLRCDSGQYVYLGEGISDTIRNTTVSGTKVLTDENYSTYINKEMSQPVIDIEYEPTSRSPQSGIAVAEAVVEAKDYTDTKIGDIDTALDSIIAMQNSYIGGNA